MPSAIPTTGPGRGATSCASNQPCRAACDLTTSTSPWAAAPSGSSGFGASYVAAASLPKTADNAANGPALRGPEGGEGDMVSGGGMLPELLIGLKEDVVIEQRHQTYPQTLAALSLLRGVFASHAAAAEPLPPYTTHYLAWLCDDLLPAFDSFSFRLPSCRWQLAASTLATLVALLLPCANQRLSPPLPC